MRLLPFRARAQRVPPRRQRQPPAPLGARPASPATFKGLGEQEVYALYKLAPIRQLAEGEALPSPNGDSPATVYLVTGGSIDLSALSPGGKVGMGVLRKGQCLAPGSLSPRDGVVYQASAREQTTVIELRSDHLEQLAPTTQAFVAKQLAATSTAALANLAARCANLSHASAELARCVQGFYEQRETINQASVVASVAETIPKLPLHTTDLMRKLFAPNARSSEIVELIKNDPPLAGLVLKTVNSSYFALATKVSDYYRAFLFLGTNNVYQLILDAGVRNILPESPEGQEIQTHSYLVSLFAQEIATGAGLRSQVCTTIGLLHDIGKTVGLLLCASTPEIARFVSMLDYASLGARLLARWGVPEEVCAVIACQHQPEFLPPDSIDAQYRKEIAALYLAHLCAELAACSGEPVSTSTAYLPAYLALLEIHEADHVEFYRRRLLPSVLKQGRPLPRRVRALLSPDGSGDGAEASP